MTIAYQYVYKNVVNAHENVIYLKINPLLDIIFLCANIHPSFSVKVLVEKLQEG